MILVTDKKFPMHIALRDNLNSIIYNLTDDWDFVSIISGTGMTRVGKSALAQQVGYYISWALHKKFDIDNIVFSGDELMRVAHKLPKNSVIIYDEARAEMDSRRTMDYVTKKLLDFFAECGMYNHFIILVAPDFFEMPRTIAQGKSEFLINVFRQGEKKKLNKEDALRLGSDVVVKFQRGSFAFYNRQKKKKLYIFGKKTQDYGCVEPNFIGDYPDYWVIDEKEYNTKKKEFLKRDRDKLGHQGVKIALKLSSHPKLQSLTDKEICEICDISAMTLWRHKNKILGRLDVINNDDNLLEDKSLGNSAI